MKIKAISLWEPWASAMALGKKCNETRDWPTNHRGDLLICAAKRPIDEFSWKLVELLGVDIETWKPPYGCALAVVELFACVPTETTAEGLIHQSQRGCTVEYLLGNYGAGRFAWRTRNLRVFKTPIPIVGRQGLFNVDLDLNQLEKAA